MDLSKLDPNSREIMEKVLENSRKRNSCSFHEFEKTDNIFRFRCKNCGCVEDGSFTLAYEQGLKHGRNGK
jgi:hypothetical protein